ncbi:MULTISPECIES: orotate phosphoribosyltransferase [Xanthobacter]|uniref:Orotate phosphoribosyltransferase n=1 Tax=Xanthobacter flavus TaxID=281 RepID=A0A9W6FLY9_XANFL|nr:MULTISPECIES: orotate phosphoribosyltransferase [Xanthobacter]MBN8916906.1 orotate phosphoribosyltransferase [Hyphomicrobiales bacterium]MDR6336088.1 orotate phosphoribosyltransferase [Xanthobacter flavus]NMN60586.1 orotate phosphoribosyltransferase [Xanthobacter sp. SG618]UDQ89501.1 orotate phosphoribosyltransferase [Xanthobacter autotrophicus]UJX43694.1 orotate phosphoribosyltransferase [Xanthobacter sp. YC-JY1]
MANVTAFPDKATIAEQTARMLLEVEAVRFSSGEPFIFTSGWASPVYIDCRRLISFPRVRQTLVDFGISTIYREIGYEQFDTVAGGETAGIPFAAWVADRMMLPMQYVRKKPKGFGRNAQIEGHLAPGERVLLVEDLTTDGKSKVNFVNALREAGAECQHCFVFFYYDIFSEAAGILDSAGLSLHRLATWWDVLAQVKKMNRFESKQVAEIESFLNDPHSWSKAHGGTATTGE